MFFLFCITFSVGFLLYRWGFAQGRGLAPPPWAKTPAFFSFLKYLFLEQFIMFNVSFYHIIERQFYSFEIDGLSVSDNFLLLSVVLDYCSSCYKKFHLSQIVGLTVSYSPVF